MSRERLLYEDVSRQVRATMEFAPDGSTIYRTRQWPGHILEHNKSLQNEQRVRGRPNTQQHMTHIAEIPQALWHEWLEELGDPNSGDPEVTKRWKNRLNDHQYRHIRTGGGQL